MFILSMKVAIWPCRCHVMTLNQGRLVKTSIKILIGAKCCIEKTLGVDTWLKGVCLKTDSVLTLYHENLTKIVATGLQC